MLGDIHYANSREQEAHRWHYRRFRDIEERAELLALSAACLLELGRLEEARTAATDALALDPECELPEELADSIERR